MMAKAMEITDDLFEPLSLYRDSLKESHANNTAIFFEELLARSKVDTQANADTVGKIRQLEHKSSNTTKSRNNWQSLQALIVFGIIICVAVIIYFVWPLFAGESIKFERNTLLAIASALAAITAGLTLIIRKIRPKLYALAETLNNLKIQHDQFVAEAWQQMQPLNKLYKWSTITQLVSKTAPRILFDPYFKNSRLEELINEFGWQNDFNCNKSVIFAQSGEIKGNPFVIAETLDYCMSTEEYTGSLHISWQERVRDADGKMHWETRHQTLYATITKPAPTYSTNSFVVYGNEAAANLSFSRTPTNLANAEGGFLKSWRLKHATRKLEKFSRNLDDDFGFTIMANKEFDVLFNALDRDHEVEFRLLFTPLAQQQMVTLLKDKCIGFGDNFTMIKNKKINIVTPQHLRKVDISANPSIFYNYDLATARHNFNNFSNNYFHALFFAFAPLLTIPLYQQHRSHANIYRSVYGDRSSFWEHESLANYYGEERFKHPKSATSSILKTKVSASDSGFSTVTVTAHSFQGHERIEYVPKLGGDGRWHNVPVHWIEYTPLQRSTNMRIYEAEGVTQLNFEGTSEATAKIRNVLQQWQASIDSIQFRRSIVSHVYGAVSH